MIGIPHCTLAPVCRQIPAGSRPPTVVNTNRSKTSPVGQSRLRFAENEDRSRRANAAPAVGDHETLQPGNPIDEPANFTDRPDLNHFWSDTWPAIKDWLEEPVPEYDLESGRVVGERPRWRAIAPYLGIPAATAAVFGIEAFAPTVAAWFGLHAPEATIIANAARGAASEVRVLKELGLVNAMGNHCRGPVNARRIDGCGIDRDQGRNLCERNQTITDSDRGG